MKFGIVVFPGSNCDYDIYYVVKQILKHDAVFLWHKERDLKFCDAIVIPGGFSYGDYLREGAIARFSPIMTEIVNYIKKGYPVLGICNGFQILLEAGVLKGAMITNRNLRFICKFVNIRMENPESIFTSSYRLNEVLKMPIAHKGGNYFADEDTLKYLQDNEMIAFRYCTKDGDVNDYSNPNGSIYNIAGIFNEDKNVLGLMPHPERAAEELLGSSDGLGIFYSMINSFGEEKDTSNLGLKKLFISEF